MKRLATPLFAALAFSAATASAQTTFRLGVRGGLNRALTTTDAAVADYSRPFTETYIFAVHFEKTPIYAWQLGPVLEVGFGKLALQTSLLFSQKGEKVTSQIRTGTIYGGTTQVAEETNINRYNWLEMPFNLAYTPHKDHGLQFFAGPYLALALGGHRNNVPSFLYPSASESIAYGSGTNNRRLDVGVNAGLGYRTGPMQVQVSYGFGLRNLHQATSPTGYYSEGQEFNSATAYNRVAQLTGTYFFAL